MGYEVLDTEVYDKGGKKGKNKKNSMKAFWIHLSIIVFFLLLLFFFFVSDITFNFSNSNEKKITLTGELSEFEKNYVGEIDMTSANFVLKTPGASFDENSQDIKIENFNGIIKLENDSIYFSGIASKITFQKNSLDLKGEKFTLISKKRTNTKLYFEDLKLNFDNGKLEYGDSVNLDFEEAEIVLNKFNTTMNYDGKFVFSGKAKTFFLNYPKDNLTLNYNG